MNKSIDIAAVRNFLLGLQQNIVQTLTQLDGQSFIHDAWQRPSNEPLSGDGLSCVIERGNLFERGGVNFSHVRGDKLPSAATAARPHLVGCGFEALGVSLVLHPKNPYCPTVHMNVRMLVATAKGLPVSAGTQPINGELHKQGATQHPRCEDASLSSASYGAVETTSSHEPVFWFGGGMDLTPYYGFAEDAQHFHQACHDALIPFGADLYPRFKHWCDEYFFLKHRNEPRGIGGIFYDDFAELGFERSLAMTKSVGEAFLKAYQPIIEKRRHLPFGEREREFQSYRRGRYAEFNLAIDRGTLFGLQSGGRTESILMSLPPVANWRYDWQPEPNSPEAQLYTDFLVARDWL